MTREEFRAQAIYVGAWVLGIVVAFGAVLVLASLLTPATDPDTLDTVVCVEQPRKPVSDSDVEAWIDSGGEYQQPGGPTCYEK